MTDSIASSTKCAVDISQLRFSWPGANQPVLDLEHFSLYSGESVFLSGQSGSGKSTLLNIISGVLDGYEGSLEVLGHDMRTLRNAQRDKLRAEHIGYIFQQFNLLPYLNVMDNATLACKFSPQRRQRACEDSGSVEAAAYALMQELGLDAELAGQTVNNLSIGQQQRVAAVRALIGGPDLIIADEPTSALDTLHRERFIKQLLATCEQRDIALLFVSHDPGLQSYFDRVVDMQELNRSTSNVLA